MARRNLTWNEAIEAVLRQSGQPMYYMDITEQIVKQGLRDDPGATPSYTVAAQFSMDKKKGVQSKFVWISTGIYGLREWNADQPEHELPEEDVASPYFSDISIQAYGIFWERSGVDWKKSSPKLLGQQFENADYVDFGGQRGIYVLFDHRALIYVGRATAQTLGSRLRDHTLDRLRTRWDRFSWFGFHTVSESGALVPPTNATIGMEEVISVLESVLIELNEPPQNRQQGKGLGGIEYLQKPDPSIGRQNRENLLASVAKILEVSGQS